MSALACIHCKNIHGWKNIDTRRQQSSIAKISIFYKRYRCFFRRPCVNNFQGKWVVGRVNTVTEKLSRNPPLSGLWGQPESGSDRTKRAISSSSNSNNTLTLRRGVLHNIFIGRIVCHAGVLWTGTRCVWKKGTLPREFIRESHEEHGSSDLWVLLNVAKTQRK